MGFKLTWVACPLSAATHLHAALGAKLEASTTSTLPVDETAVVQTSICSLVVDSSMSTFTDPEAVAHLSSTVGTLYWFVHSDTVMITALACFVDGTQTWMLRHEDDSLIVEGNLPTEIELLMGERTDYDVVRDIGHRVTGFAYDQEAVFEKVWLPRAVSMLKLSRSRTADAKLADLAGRVCLERVELERSKVTEIGLGHLRSHTGLKRLDLSGTRVSDGSLALLAPLRALEQLQLNDTAVTTAGIEHLLGFDRLTVLGLGDTAIDDDALELLKALPLEELQLFGTSVTDAGLQALADHPSLKRVLLGKTAVSDEGMGYLARLPALDCLYLNDTAVTDAGIADFEGHPKLAQVSLNGTTITDSSLTLLSTLRLRWLSVQKTNVTPEGVEAFRKVRRAHCHVQV